MESRQKSLVFVAVLSIFSINHLLAQSAAINEAVVYHPFPKLERHLAKRIKKVPEEIRRELVIALDDKEIMMLPMHINTDSSRSLMELEICFLTRQAEFHPAAQMFIGGQGYPVYFRTTDGAFTQVVCDVDLRKYDGVPIMEVKFNVANRMVVDMQNKKFYTSRSKWLRKQYIY